jgi:hypothetical protein
MKKLCVLPTIALALTGLLLLTACPTESKSGVNTSTLEATIQDARDVQSGVEKADDAADVAKGVYWVTKAQMTAFNADIEKAEAVRDNPSSQSSVNTAKKELKTAIDTFKKARKEGTAPAITLSGTITVKENGQTVPFIGISAHDNGWQNIGTTRFASSGTNVPWSIIIKEFSYPKRVYFRVTSFTDSSLQFNFDIEDFWFLHEMEPVYNKDVSGIFIDLENLKTITLSGTINISYDGKPVPSIVIMAGNPAISRGEAYVRPTGNNTPWSMKIKALDDWENIGCIIYCQDGPNFYDDKPLCYLVRDVGWVKDENLSDIVLDVGNIEP